MSAERAVGPLEGVKIAGLALALSGRWAIGLLAAEVIEAEPPRGGAIERWADVARGGAAPLAQR